VEKTISLRRGQARIDFHHRFTNRGKTTFPFLWKLHPALAVSPQHRIDFPPMKVVLEPAFPGTLAGASEPVDWPLIKTAAGNVDLRRITPEDARQLYFFYGTQMKGNWCALTNSATGLSCGLQFDPAVFPCCWLFATYGGWRSYNVAVLEPCTGYPLNFEAMKAAGRHRRASRTRGRSGAGRGCPRSPGSGSGGWRGRRRTPAAASRSWWPTTASASGWRPSWTATSAWHRSRASPRAVLPPVPDSQAPSRAPGRGHAVTFCLHVWNGSKIRSKCPIREPSQTYSYFRSK